jgi:dynein heavy chain
MPPFDNILSEFGGKEKQLFQAIATSAHPFAQPLPEHYAVQGFISKLILYKCLRPEKMIEGFSLLVENCLGPQFTRSLPFDLAKIYPDSAPQTPLLFILSPGSDPFVAVSNFSKAKGIPL